MSLKLEDQYLERKRKLLESHLSDYKRIVVSYLKEGIEYSYFDKETNSHYATKLDDFNKANEKYIQLLNIFNQLKERFNKNPFNKVINGEDFKNHLSKHKFSKGDFITAYARHKAIEGIKYDHINNSACIKLIFEVYYDDKLKSKINIFDLPIFLKKDDHKIKETENKLHNILYPQPKVHELYPLILFNVEFTLRDVATLIILMSGYYNIRPKHKSELLDIARMIFGDISLEMIYNTPNNKSRLYDYISQGKGLFIENKYDYRKTKYKIYDTLSYEETNKFDRFKTYIKEKDLKGFKDLIDRK